MGQKEPSLNVEALLARWAAIGDYGLRRLRAASASRLRAP